MTLNSKLFSFLNSNTRYCGANMNENWSSSIGSILVHLGSNQEMVIFGWPVGGYERDSSKLTTCLLFSAKHLC
jgi:hypothetical protein